MMMATEQVVVSFDDVTGPREVENHERDYAHGDLVILPDRRLGQWVRRADKPGYFVVEVDNNQLVEVAVCHGGDLHGTGVWASEQTRNRDAGRVARRLASGYTRVNGQPYKVLVEPVHADEPRLADRAAFVATLDVNVKEGY